MPDLDAEIDGFLAAVGALADPEREGEQHRLALEGVELVLRRDCHGALRRLHASFAPDRRAGLRAALPAPGGWTTVAADALELADAPGLGRLYLLADRLELHARLAPRPELLRTLLRTFAGAPPSPGPSPQAALEDA